MEIRSLREKKNHISTIPNTNKMTTISSNCDLNPENNNTYLVRMYSW